MNGKPIRAKLDAYSGVAPKARIISLKVLDGNGGGYTSSVLQRTRVRDREPRQTEDRHHQPVARPPRLRIARHRPAGARRRGCGSRRHRRRHVGGQLRHQPGDRRKSATPASRRPATPLRRSPSARSTRSDTADHGDDTVAHLQLARAGVVFGPREAGHRRARQPPRGGRRIPRARCTRIIRNAA